MKRERVTERERDRQTDRETERQTERETDRQTEREREDKRVADKSGWLSGEWGKGGKETERKGMNGKGK